MNKDNISDELIRACQNLVKEIDRVQLAKKNKIEEEKRVEAEKEARREYWSEVLFSEDSKAMTLILPDNSRLHK
jgi:phosphopantothenate synthetase